jgi:hypothetical protein
MARLRPTTMVSLAPMVVTTWFFRPAFCTVTLGAIAASAPTATPAITRVPAMPRMHARLIPTPSPRSSKGRARHIPDTEHLSR